MRDQLLSFRTALAVAIALVLAATLGAVLLVSAQTGHEAAKPSPQPYFLPGLPIDTPPSAPGFLETIPPPGEEALWQGVASWAAVNCGGSWGSPSSTTPVSMFKTTAGELRRRVAASVPEAGNPLGSKWKNSDIVFVVAFRGTYYHPQPPLPDPEQQQPLLSADTCIYIGNSRTDNSDNGEVGIATVSDPSTLEGLWGYKQDGQAPN